MTELLAKIAEPLLHPIRLHAASENLARKGGLPLMGPVSRRQSPWASEQSANRQSHPAFYSENAVVIGDLRLAMRSTTSRQDACSLAENATSASTSSGHNTANAYRRLVPRH